MKVTSGQRYLASSATERHEQPVYCCVSMLACRFEQCSNPVGVDRGNTTQAVFSDIVNLAGVDCRVSGVEIQSLVQYWIGLKTVCCRYKDHFYWTAPPLPTSCIPLFPKVGGGALSPPHLPVAPPMPLPVCLRPRLSIVHVGWLFQTLTTRWMKKDERVCFWNS